jgi:hypothetical protein
MLTKGIWKNCSALMLMLILSNGASVFAQSSNSKTANAESPQKIIVSEEFIKEAERNRAEKEKFKAESEAKTEIIVSQSAQIAALRGLLDVEKLISKDWKESALARKDVIKTDDKIIPMYEQQLLKLNERVAKAESAKLKWGFAGTVLGAALVLLARK